MLFGKELFSNFKFGFSSVLPPKDVSSFRAEREHALRRGLQVRLEIHLLLFNQGQSGAKGKLISNVGHEKASGNM